MKDTNFTQSEIVQIYNASNDKIKSMLVEKYGKEYFESKITDKVKSFEDACKIKGIVPESILPFSNPINDMQEVLNAYAKMFLICEVLNEGWEADWDNSHEYKYYPYFDMREHSGSGFSYGDCGGWNANAYVGSRLCFKSRELAEYAGKQFTDIYKVMFKKSNKK